MDSNAAIRSNADLPLSRSINVIQQNFIVYIYKFFKPGPFVTA